MTIHSLAELLFEYGILSAICSTRCARMQYAKYQGGELPPCTCRLHEIQAEVRHQLADTHKERLT